MIDLSTETVVSLTEATRHLPRRRRGKRPNVATVYRWAQRGCKGVRLEIVQVGGTKCTSLEALQRFCNRLTEPEATTPLEATAERSRRRQHDIECAERECRVAGM